MLKISIPQDIVLKIALPQGTREVPKNFQSFVEERLNDPQHFGRTSAAVESRVAIKKELAGKAAGDVMELRQEDWEVLVASVKTPSNPYIPELAEQSLPFIYAIVNPK